MRLCGRLEALRFRRSLPWLTESKAFEILIETATVSQAHFCSLMPSAMALARGRSVEVRDLLARKPCCKMSSSKCLLRYRRISRSRILEEGQRREI